MLRLLMFCLLCALPAVAQEAPPAPSLLGVDKIWDAAPHSAFTDIVVYRDALYCTFREAPDHAKGEGTIRILRSADGTAWESVANLKEPGIDLRDPKLSDTGDGRLMLLCGGSRLIDGRPQFEQTRAAFSAEGTEWSPFFPVWRPSSWLWRVSWHDKKAWGIAYPTGARTGAALELVVSRDGINFERAQFIDFDGEPNEATLRFQADGTLVALVRRDGEPGSGLIGTSAPPYATWTWNDAERRIGGPDFIVDPQGRMWAGGRDYGEKTSTIFARMTPETLTPLMTLPSGGDTSYPGFALFQGTLYMSYYSSHEEKTSIYVARIQLPE